MKRHDAPSAPVAYPAACGLSFAENMASAPSQFVQELSSMIDAPGARVKGFVHNVQLRIRCKRSGIHFSFSPAACRFLGKKASSRASFTADYADLHGLNGNRRQIRVYPRKSAVSKSCFCVKNTKYRRERLRAKKTGTVPNGTNCSGKASSAMRLSTLGGRGSRRAAFRVFRLSRSFALPAPLSS